jgi:hypothetical protein
MTMMQTASKVMMTLWMMEIPPQITHMITLRAMSGQVMLTPQTIVPARRVQTGTIQKAQERQVMLPMVP